MVKWDPKSKPLWLSTITQNRNYQDSTYETDRVLGSVDLISNEGELARRVIGSVCIIDFKQSECNIYGNNRNRKQEQNSHSDEEPKLKNQGTDSDDMKHCKEHNRTFLSNTHRTSNNNEMGNNINHIRNSHTRDIVRSTMELFLVTPMEQVTTMKRETTVTITEIVTPETWSKWHWQLFRVGILL